MKAISIFVKKLPHAKDLSLPAYATELSAGADLCACIDEPVKIKPFQRVLIPTGICIQLPRGFEAQVRPRSGLALRHGVTVLNAPGTIDADYRDEVKVILVNLGQEDFVVERGMRIAQLVISPVCCAQFVEADELSKTERKGGFGSTGV